MRNESVIEDVDPRKPIDAVLKLVITDKKTPGHHTNLRKCLDRAKEKGVRLRRDKSTIFENQVNWFGRVFWDTGASASPDKIDTLSQAGRPTTVEEVRSLLQACTVNAKFTFNHGERRSYSEITAPLQADAGQGGDVQVDRGERGQLPGTDLHDVIMNHPEVFQSQEAHTLCV